MYDLELWKKVKREKKITFEELASQADVSISTLKDIFRGVRINPRVETVEAIEKALGIKNEPSTFVKGPDAVRHILLENGVSKEKADKLTSSDIDKIIAYIKGILDSKDDR